MPIRAGESGQCPHCKYAVRFEPMTIHAGNSARGTAEELRFTTNERHRIVVVTVSCPRCGRPILIALETQDPTGSGTELDQLLWPDASERPVPPEVDAENSKLASDFREAVAVFPKSKKASAALSRRCLQVILTTKGGATKRDLADQIDEVLPKLPAQLAQNVDAIRHVGNFAAHPMKSKSSGEIAEVEDGEADWLLEVLEELFDHYYVAPARAAERRAALNKKLQDLGKPPLKEPPRSGPSGSGA